MHTRVYVYMCMCIYIYIYTYIYIYIERERFNPAERISIRRISHASCVWVALICVIVCMCIYIHIYIYTYIYICVCVYTYIYIYTHIRIGMHLCMYLIHTHIHKSSGVQSCVWVLSMLHACNRRTISEHFLNSLKLFGWHHLPNATCLIRPRLFFCSVTCLTRLLEFAASFATFEESMC